VLITNVSLASRTGTELYVRDLALELLHQGHTPVVYSPTLGPLAEEVRQKTIPVVDDLSQISNPPDIIHGHHNLETVTALLAFPRVPAVYFIHDNLSLNDVPPKFQRILRYVAVDYTCCDRLLFEYGITEDRVRVIFNSVNLELFKPRGLLPSRPARALIYSHWPSRHFEAVRTACTCKGIALDVLGAEFGTTSQPEVVLGKYDIVFAKARSAIEAMACGAAVVLCDYRGVGPMVTSREFDRLRKLNFGHRALCNPIHPDVILSELDRYNPKDAAEVTRFVRSKASLSDMTDELISLYQEVLQEYAVLGAPDADIERQDVANFLHWMSCSRKQREDTLNNSTIMVLRNRLVRLPLAGRLIRILARKLSNKMANSEQGVLAGRLVIAPRSESNKSVV
jgi:Glycosyltransferase Family 4